MKYLTTVLILILASTNASKFFQPDGEFQQDPDYTKDKYQDIITDLATYDDDRFLPQVNSMDEVTRWESPPDQNVLLLSDLEALENLLQENLNDWRTKRDQGPGSLSIDNPLDVLRDHYVKSMSRKMKFKSFENRDQFGSAGKRSRKGNRFQLRLSSQLKFPKRMTRRGFFENGIGERGTRLAVTRIDRNPRIRRYQRRLNGPSYQT